MTIVRLSKSIVSRADKEAVLKVLDSEYLGMGEAVQAFEMELQKLLKTTKEVVCVNSGTAALHLALQACGIGPADEVLVPSLTYVASLQAISATGATPVTCDIREDTLFIDSQDAEKRLTENTKAIMPVHYASDSQHMPEIYEFANKNGLRVIEDAAHSFGCKRGGKYVGCEGDIICFSFDGIKNITSGEGGAILTSDINVLQKIRDARLLGVEKDTDKRFSGQRSWEFDVKEQGWRYHMSNIMAALGREQLKRIEHIKSKRQTIANKYLGAFAGMSYVNLLELDYHNIIPHIFVIRIKDKNRDALRQFLLENNIETGIHYFPNHLLTKFETSYSLPVTEKSYSEILSLPCHLDLTNDQQEFVISTIKDFFHD